ncbi:IS3 family transposase [Streptococcus thoraltensis]|uniref:IS3 family transposase n=1 Tax=Streptococcus thoraltensis TaxID=55085 RepID=UPI000360BCD1|nr:transposase [Streptococcus thoraltensis]
MDDYPIAMILDCFDVSKTTYYRWKSEQIKAKTIGDITEKIVTNALKNGYIYGYRTITQLLKSRYGLTVNHKKVYRVMKQNSWLCRMKT